ncbi:transcription initiation factor TFIID component TAF4 family-domain-containing protein [Rhodocollybia butyracea]|uniref:Transcription initiation factor TFIID subunit 4 n=1 Tax=Rhodocollybia butyracea TaxID=206335 RepID=A0A9P5U681_9AGAR|nr:transcription initiation factor TFIID component TAF4 family-domain-containing protein [Rhodocollybia butyracea]
MEFTIKMNQTTPAPTSASSTPTPVPGTPQPQQLPAGYNWSNMAIDPALQAQSVSTPTASGTPVPMTSATPYQQYSYGNYYQSQYGQYAATTYAPSATPAPVTAAATASAAGVSQGAMDTSDINTLRDALGSTGVDLRAEEESLQRTSDTHLSFRSYDDRTRKQPPKPSFDTAYLSSTVSRITSTHALPSPHPSPDTVNYLALALRARLQDLITGMITAAKHRTDTQFDRPPSMYEDTITGGEYNDEHTKTPMWSLLLRSDVAKQLKVLERIERDEELKIRRERKERTDMAAAHAAALAAQSSLNNPSSDGGFDDDDSFASGGTKKKRKKDGPGVTAKNMSADVQKKMSNAAASHAAGLTGLTGRYSWMTAAAASTPVKKAGTPAPATPTPTFGATTSGATGTSTTTPGSASNATSSWARPYVSSKKPETVGSSESSTPPIQEDTRTAITMRDAMFVIQKERGHGGGRGAALGWT